MKMGEEKNLAFGQVPSSKFPSVYSFLWWPFCHLWTAQVHWPLSLSLLMPPCLRSSFLPRILSCFGEQIGLPMKGKCFKSNTTPWWGPLRILIEEENDEISGFEYCTGAFFPSATSAASLPLDENQRQESFTADCGAMANSAPFHMQMLTLLPSQPVTPLLLLNTLITKKGRLCAHFSGSMRSRSTFVSVCMCDDDWERRHKGESSSGDLILSKTDPSGRQGQRERKDNGKDLQGGCGEED